MYNGDDTPQVVSTLVVELVLVVLVYVGGVHVLSGTVPVPVPVPVAVPLLPILVLFPVLKNVDAVLLLRGSTTRYILAAFWGAIWRFQSSL